MLVVAPLAVPSEVPPVLAEVVLLYHWYVKSPPTAVTETGVKATFKHLDCAAVDWLVMAVTGFTRNAPDMAEVADPQVPVTMQ